MHCHRFERDVHITRHARERMAERRIAESELINLLETGITRYKDDVRLWIAKEVPSRKDNLVCAAVILEDKLVVKTVMHHFQWED
ncbi:DUF4258 domain-containing protein [Halomonas sp. LR5S13]|uniref:DUF4258 domain-containing protein n=1 Tax=Halomonas rhizosphaerae TaxID=3043296 RepID=UPI0024A8C12A|nr:DUF4258 domain-containing protein [Halomonas rhizosphaerae]MDI5921018.1 DUF4258 domain-containing protein [Halomonas rhizosphaerae]